MKGAPAVTCSYCLVGGHRRCVGACACTVGEQRRAKARRVGSASAAPPGSFTARRICQLAGITYRQLDYWARSELIRPSVADAQSSGTKRCYSADDVRVILTIKHAIDAGCSLQSVRSAVPLIRENDGCRWLVLGAEPVVCAAEELTRVIAEAGGVCTIVDLEADAFAVTGRSPPAA